MAEAARQQSRESEPALFERERDLESGNKQILLFSNVRVNSYTTVEDSIVLPQANIGRNCRITKAIIEKGCEVPEGTVIGENRAEDEKKYFISPGGVVLVTPEMLGQKLHFVR